MKFNPEYDETARIVLLDMREDKTILITMLNFAGPMRIAHPEITITEIATLWTRYMGFDGRVLPTHVIETGLPR